MKRHFFTLFLLIIAFGLGYLTAQFRVDDRQEPILEKERISQQIDVSDLDQLLNLSNPVLNQDTLAGDQASQKISQKQQAQIKDLIQQSSDEKVQEYLGKIYPKTDFSSIHNKKKFSQRLIDEFSQSHNEPIENLTGRVVISRQEGVAQSEQDLSRIHAQQYLYAHLDTLNKIDSRQQVFIRWIYRDTGEVLLFMPQQINENQAQNWVSFKPSQGWKVGNYDVRYYQFVDDLTPIAQTSYTILEVSEDLQH